MTRSRGVVDRERPCSAATSVIAGMAGMSCEEELKASDELTSPEVGGVNPDEAAMAANDDGATRPLEGGEEYPKVLNTTSRSHSLLG